MFQIFEPFLMLLLLIVMGAALYSLRLFKLDLARQWSSLVVRVTFPAMLFVMMYKNISLEMLRRGWVFPLIGLLASILLAVSANFYGKRAGLAGKTFGTLQILCTNGNNIFLPVPIISAIYGPEYLVYAFLFELGAGLFYWSYGVSYFREGPSFNLKRLLNQNMLALLLGLFAGLVGLRLPGYLLGALEIVGNITIGSALLIIGVLAAHLVKTNFHWRREVLIIIVHRLLLSPLVGLVFLPFLALTPDLQAILLLMLSMPPLVTTALVAANFAADENLATLGVVVPTLLSFVIVPVVLWLFS